MTSSSASAVSAFAAQDRCPACDGEGYNRVGPVAPGCTVEVGGRAFVQPPFEARRCTRCHLVFKSAIAASEVLSDYYRRIDSRRWDYLDLLPNERPILDLLQALPAGGRVLDFGCSTGRLLGRVIDRHTCFGVEVNPAAAAAAAARGITMLAPDDSAPDLKFDAVVMVDVFEHLTCPLAVLRGLAARVLPGGVLIVGTGNADAPAVRGEPALFWYFELIEHLCMLTPAHAWFVAADLGLTLIRQQRCSHYDMPWSLRVRQWAYAATFEVFHRSRSRWLRAILGLVPKVRNARRWTTRPVWNSSADHLILVFQKPYSPARLIP